MTFDIKKISKEWRQAVKNDPARFGKHFYANADRTAFVVFDTPQDDSYLIEEGLEPIYSQDAIKIMEASNKAEEAIEVKILEAAKKHEQAKKVLVEKIRKESKDKEILEILDSLI